jgi:hypothetical protein
MKPQLVSGVRMKVYTTHDVTHPYHHEHKRATQTRTQTRNTNTQHKYATQTRNTNTQHKHATQTRNTNTQHKHATQTQHKHAIRPPEMFQKADTRNFPYFWGFCDVNNFLITLFYIFFQFFPNKEKKYKI